MALKVQIKRGESAAIPVLAPGELALSTDEKKLYLGTEDGNIAFLREDEINAQMFKKANALVGDVQSLGYTSLADIVIQGVYRIYDGPSFLTDYPPELSRDGLNYCTLTVDVAIDYISYHIIATNAAGTLVREVVGFSTFRPPDPPKVSGWVRTATATKPEEHPLPLAAGYAVQAGYKSCYSKAQNGFSVIHVAVRMSSGEPLAAGYHSCATIPPGYFPSGGVGISSSDCTITVQENGNVSLWLATAREYAIFTVPYYAAT